MVPMSKLLKYIVREERIFMMRTIIVHTLANFVLSFNIYMMGQYYINETVKKNVLFETELAFIF